jgi:hypothetical protein
VRPLPLIGLMLILMVSVSWGDSIFDIRGGGKDVVPVAGATRAMGGATLASLDPVDCAGTSPFASALAERVTLTAGIAHLSTRTDDRGKDKFNINTLFPTLTAIIPYKRVAFMTGLYVEKEGRLTLSLTDSAYASTYTFSYRREVSAQSVPLYISTRLHHRVVASAGILFSAIDLRETHRMDFALQERTDTDDAIDLSASGHAFAGGLLVDLGPLRAAGFFRSKMDLDGALVRESRYAGVWETKDIGFTCEESYRFGARVIPHRHIAFEVDYEKSPWSRIELDDKPIAGHAVYRWSVGMEYRGDILWDAAKFPVMAGYYKQPLDWDGPLTGEIVEQVFSLGTSIPVAEGRAGVAFALEFGRRETEKPSDLSETFYGLTISVSAIEAWRREVKTSP